MNDQPRKVPENFDIKHNLKGIEKLRRIADVELETIRHHNATTAFTLFSYPDHSPPGEGRDHFRAPRRVRSSKRLFSRGSIALCKTTWRKRQSEWFPRRSKVWNTNH